MTQSTTDRSFILVFRLLMAWTFLYAAWLGGEAFVRRAQSVAAFSRRLISNALVRRSWVPPHRHGGGPAGSQRLC
jgi:uncharacterized membrane protein YphA (DoxX/SURF4 family)